MRFNEHLRLSAFWFATNFHWGAILLLLIPGDMKVLAPQNHVPMVGFITGIGAIPALIVPLISGALSDRCTRPEGRRKPYIATGVIVNIVGLIGMAMSVQAWKSIPLYIVSFLIIQIGNNIATGAYMGIIPDLVPEGERGKASGFMGLMSQLGTLLGSVAIGMLLGEQPPLVKYGLIGIVLTLIGGLTYFGVKEKPLESAEPLEWKSYLKSLWIDPRQYPDFAWVWFTRFLVMMGFYAIMPFINPYLVDVVGVAQANVSGTAPQLLGVVLLVSSISGIYGGVLSDKIGRKRVVYISNALIAVVAPMFILARSVPIALVIGAFFGLAYGAYISVDYALGTDVLPNKEDAGKDMAVWHIAMTLPQTIIAPIAGILIALPGKTVLPPIEKGGEEIAKYTHTGYGIVFGICAVCFALGAYLLRNVRKVN
jgi:MFS family permease